MTKDTHITIPMARLIELETAEHERDLFRSERLDLALLVGRLMTGRADWCGEYRDSTEK